MAAADAVQDASSDIVVDAIVEGDTLQQFIDSFTPIVHEAKLHFNEDGLQAKAVDPANIALADVHLDTAAFESYQSGRVTIGVDLKRFEELISVANAGDLIHLVVDMETRMLNIEIRNIEQSLALFDPDAIRAEPEVPELDDELSAEVALEGAQLDEAVTVADMVSDHIQFASDPDAREFVISAEGDTDDSTVTFGDEELINADVSDDGETLLSVNYVADIVKPIPNGAEVTIEHGDEFPAFLEYDTCEGHLSVMNMLAPRIQTR